jgi:hypothetical protein
VSTAGSPAPASPGAEAAATATAEKTEQPKRRGFWAKVFGFGDSKKDEDKKKEEERKKQEEERKKQGIR